MKNFVWTLKGFIAVCGCLLLWQAPASAQKPAARLDNALVTFFSGHWKGEGAFANGRPISAELVFRPSLDSAWLVCEHRDLPPNGYKADLYWGVDATTGAFVAYAFDNFQGHREFASPGWVDGKLQLQRQAQAPGVGTYYERFEYQRLTGDSFRMSYETSRDGAKWGLGDSLVFRRR
jgi:hypothetical protein